MTDRKTNAPEYMYEKSNRERFDEKMKKYKTVTPYAEQWREMMSEIMDEFDELLPDIKIDLRKKEGGRMEMIVYTTGRPEDQKIAKEIFDRIEEKYGWKRRKR